MATSARIRLQDDIKRDLQTQGASVRMLDSWPAKATYYKPDGEVLPNLPADPWSMKRYLARGLTLVPPDQLPKAAAPGKFRCEICGRDDFKAEIGRIGHMRSHK